MINLADVAPGDQIGIEDRASNFARGVVARRGVTLIINAFGVPIEFARTNGTGKVVPAGPVRVIEHTPALIGGAA